MRKGASITVFLSLILVCVSALICALLESARTAGVRYYLQTAADAAMDNLYSNYHRQLWEQYRLILYEGVDEDTLSKDFLKYMKNYEEGSHIFAISDTTAEVRDMRRITDDHAFWFGEQVKAYLLYNLIEPDGSEEDVSKLKYAVEQANTMQEIIKSYGSHTKEATEVERSLSGISQTMKDIAVKRDELYIAISGRSSTTASQILSDISLKISSLEDKLKGYQSAADALDTKLLESEEELQDEWDKLSEANRASLSSRIAAYRDYTAADGPRRLEVESKIAETKLIDETMDDRHEILNNIMLLELSLSDTEEYWLQLESTCADITVPTINSAHGMADSKKQDGLERTMDFLSADIVALVLPQGRNISKGKLDKSLLPSTLPRGGKEYSADMYKQIMLNEYASRFFSDFTDEADKSFAYELEYIYAGFDTDEANLKATLLAILGLRTGMNYMHIIMDAQKMTDINNLAMSISGALGMPMLSMIISFFIISVWALAEAVIDLKALLNKEKVAFLKSSADWRLDLDSMMNISEHSGIPATEDKGSGLEYEDYIKFLLLASNYEGRDYRMMDMIEKNISLAEPSFKMHSMVHAAKLRLSARSARVFSKLSISASELIGLSSEFTVYREVIAAY